MKLIGDSALVEKSKRVLNILLVLHIDDWQSQAHKQWQNPAERRYQTVKRMINNVLDYSGAPDKCWLLAGQHVWFLLNHIR